MAKLPPLGHRKPVLRLGVLTTIFSLPLSSAALAGQTNEPEPPQVFIEPDGGTVTGSSQRVTIIWCAVDAYLDPSSRQMA